MATIDDKINLFKKVATQQGYDPAEIEMMAGMAKMKEEEKSAYDPSTDPVVQRQVYLKGLEEKPQPFDPNTDPTIQRELYLKGLKTAPGLPEIPQEQTEQQLEKAKKEEAKAEIGGVINKLLSEKKQNVERITGAKSYIPVFRGEDAKYTESLYNQLKGMLSLENREKLKGSGQISDYESKLLAQASTALDKGLSTEDFYKVLNELSQAFGGKEKTPEEITGLPPVPEPLKNEGMTVDDLIGKVGEAAPSLLGPIGEIGMNTERSKAIPGGVKGFVQEFTEGLPAQLSGEIAPKQQTIKDVILSGTPLGELLLNSGSELLKKSVPASADVLSITLLPEVFKWGAGKFAEKFLMPKKMLSELRVAKAAASQKTIDGNVIQEGLKKYVFEQASPDDFERSKELLKISQKFFGNKNLTITEALNRSIQANDAFTKAGSLRTPAGAQYNAVMSRLLKQMIEKEAPEVARITSQLNLLYKIPKTLKTAAWYLGPTAAIYGTGKAIAGGLKNLGQ